MYTTSLVSAALLAGAAVAQAPSYGATAGSSYDPSQRVCVNTTVPVNITSRNAVFGGLTTPLDNIAATAFANDATRNGDGNATAQILTGYKTYSGVYNISTKYCVPSANFNGSAVQVLNHGIGFDKSYWDISFANYNYSYTNNALSKGYATVAIDRLGIADSSHGDPRDEIQSFLEIEGLRAISQGLRTGAFSFTKGKKFNRVINVGHSFGSAQTYQLAYKYPEVTDGIVLTGFSMNGSFVNLFTAGNDLVQARYNQPLRFGGPAEQKGLLDILNGAEIADALASFDPTTFHSYNYPLGYLTNSNAAALQYLFFYYGYFNPELLYNLERTGKQPVTPGEALTLTALTMSNTFKKPVLVITGDQDLPYCGGNCSATGGTASSIPAQVKKNFPMADFTAYIQPNTGHGLNAHYNSTGAYNVIQNFLASKGLGSN